MIANALVKVEEVVLCEEERRVGLQDAVPKLDLVEVAELNFVF